MDIVQQIQDFSTEFFNHALGNMHSSKYSMKELMKDAELFSRNLTLTLVSNIMEKTDDALYESVKPRHQYQIKERSRERHQITLLGELVFQRRYYLNQLTGKYEYLLDQWMDISPRERIDECCQSVLAEHSAHMGYQKSARLSTPCGLSGQSVKNVVEKIGILPNQAADLPKRKDNIKEIYVEADEDHVSMQEGPSRQLKLIYVYEKKEKVSKNRRKLIAKRVFTGYEKAEELWEEVNEYIQQTYGKKVKVTIIGDGAGWIRCGLGHIGQSRFALDGFHEAKYIREIAGQEETKELYDSIKVNDKERFQKETNRMLKKNPEREKYIKEGFSYLMSQWMGAQVRIQNKEVASSTEGHVSHILSKRLSTVGMGWSEAGSERIARLRTLEENGGNIREYILQERKSKKEKGREICVIREEVKRHLDKKRLTYCNYRGDMAYRMPGSESAENGWMRAIENSGFYTIA